MDNKKIEKLRALIQEQYINIAGIIVLKDNQIVYEDYFDGYNENNTIHIASVTKSIMSALIGIAIDQGLIKSINQKVLDYFPEYKIKRGESTIQKITIQHLLTMTAPYKYRSEPYTKVYSSDDWTKAALDLLGGKSEIGEFNYSTVGIQILSGILSKATGKTVLDFATKNLFVPLGLNIPHNVSINSKEQHIAFLKDRHVTGWVVDPKGENTAGWGLTLTTRDMLKFGQLYLNRGLWHGKQIIQPKWIKNSLTEHSQWGEFPYGYLWWIIKGKYYNCYAALGDGGNIIYIDPEKSIVIVITSRFMPRAKDRIELIRKHITALLDD